MTEEECKLALLKSAKAKSAKARKGEIIELTIVVPPRRWSVSAVRSRDGLKLCAGISTALLRLWRDEAKLTPEVREAIDRELAGRSD